MSELDFMMAYEDSGLVWKLQGHYGRTAKHLIDDGLCHAKEGQT